MGKVTEGNHHPVDSYAFVLYQSVHPPIPEILVEIF